MTARIERACGLDPFDALRGSRVPRWVRSNRRARQVAIQVRKRFAWDLAPVYGVSPFYMAKTLGAFCAADSRARRAGKGESAPEEFAEALLQRDDIARLGEGAWGYEFDVQTRWAFYPSGSANVIATVFCARGLAEAGLVCGAPDWTHQLHASAGYLVARHLDPQGWFRYTPDSTRLVHNANLLGAALVAASAVLSGAEAHLEVARRAAAHSISAQRSDGSWPYGVGADLQWSDNFHTAYNLDSLLLLWLAGGDSHIERALHLGATAWANAFFSEDGAPAYFLDGSGKHDVHSAGTAIDVAARLAQHGACDPDLASRVMAWTDAHLVAADGSTYASEKNGRIDRRHFVRWGDAHVALGRGSLALAQADVLNPLEDAIKRGA